MSETSYPYAIGRIKVQEAGLIDRTRWNRLWEADETERSSSWMKSAMAQKPRTTANSIT